MSDYRYQKINELFIQFSLGNLDYRIDVSDKLDEIDAFISNINMLGEELKEKTISKDFFNNIFNSVSDLIIVLDINGNIQTINKAVVNKIQSEDNAITGSINSFLKYESGELFDFERIIHDLDKRFNFQLQFTYQKVDFPVLCSFSKLISNETEKHIGFILVIKDLTNLRELEATLRISEEKYHKLFEESSDAILIINNKGKIFELNSTGKELLGIQDRSSLPESIYQLITEASEKKNIRLAILGRRNLIDLKVRIFNHSTNIVRTCYLSLTKISSSDYFQVIIKDVTEQIELENLVIRTITDTQENERIRLARDIHDSLGQQLSAIKFYLSALSTTKSLDEKSRLLLNKSEEGLRQILASTREICFNLMPQTIENFGLVAAVEELCNNTSVSGNIHFKITLDQKMERLSLEKEISIFRIIQEFINNSIKHAHSKKIRIRFSIDQERLKVILKDDGIGFDMDKINEESKGMGLKNVFSRAKSHNGELKIISGIGAGVKYILWMPL